MSMNEAPYIFSAFSKAPTCAASEQTCDRINFFADAAHTNLYAKAYVVPQSFSNCASPTAALRRGTFFNDLYMHYTTVNPCCKEVKK